MAILVMKNQACKNGSIKMKKNNNGFSRKCASLIKEQRARVYILCRCATMLLCWSINEDDD